MAATQQPKLSAKVTQPLRRIAARGRWLLMGRGMLQSLAISLAIWLGVVVVLGTFADLPAGWCIAFIAFAWAAPAASAAWFLRPVLRRRPLRLVAYDVERTLSDGSQEIITSAVELSADSDPRFVGSPQLLERLMQQAEAAVDRVHPELVLPSSMVYRWALLLVPVVMVWLLLSLLPNSPVPRGLYRMFSPMQATLPARFSHVKVTPGGVTVAQGDPLEITVIVDDGAGSRDVGYATLCSRYAGGHETQADLQRIGPRAFRTKIERVQDSFRYRIVTDQGDSPTFDVTVQQRPAISGMDLRYIYPSYTHLPSKTEPSSDGRIEAIVGTEVELTIHSSIAVRNDSRLLVGEGSDAVPIALLPTGGTDYRGTLKVLKSGSYRIQLLSEQGLEGSDQSARQIVARPDSPPGIKIISPAATIAVRSDDAIPVKFEASDDFGIARVGALVQIDGQPDEAFDVKLAAPGSPGVSGAWQLSIPYHLGHKALSNAGVIRYALRATDTRDPNPQSTTTAKQTLNIDSGQAQSYAARQEAEAARKLADAIKKAIGRLAASERSIKPLTDLGAKRMVPTETLKTAAAQKDDLAQTSKDLTAAADASLAAGYTNLAATAKKISEEKILAAAQSLAEAGLSADDPEPRQRQITSAATNVTAAKKELEAMVSTLEAQEIARAIDDISRRQARLADAMKAAEQQPRQAPANQQKQAELRQQLDQAIAKSKDLQSPEQQQIAQKAAELTRNAANIAAEEKALAKAVEKEGDVKEVQQKLNELARRQKELNIEVAQLQREQALSLAKAQVNILPKAQMDQVVQQLNQDRPAQAAQVQKQQAAALAKAAENLAQQEKSPSRSQGPAAPRARRAGAGQGRGATKGPRQAREAAPSRQGRCGSREDSRRRGQGRRRRAGKGAAGPPENPGSRQQGPSRGSAGAGGRPADRPSRQAAGRCRQTVGNPRPPGAGIPGQGAGSRRQGQPRSRRKGRRGAEGSRGEEERRRRSSQGRISAEGSRHGPAAGCDGG